LFSMCNNVYRNTYVFSLTLLFLFLSCGNKLPDSKLLDSTFQYASYHDIPGVTQDEINAINTLRKQFDHFTYGMVPCTESFHDENGDLKGFSVLFCEWLTALFDIPFILKNTDSHELLTKLAVNEINFTGAMTATEKQRKTYFMTSPIALHTVRCFRIADSAPLESIAEFRPLRYALIEGSSTIDLITSKLTPGTYEIVLSGNIDEIYRMLKNTEVDAALLVNKETVFDIYGDVVAADFYPLIYTSVSMATQNPALQPIIAVIQRALDNGALRYLAELQEKGYLEYLKHKLSLYLNDEERRYIEEHPVIPFTTSAINYPVSFYNEREKQWQGISFDILSDVEALTGMSFKRVNDENTRLPAAMLDIIDEGKASMVTELMHSAEWEKKIIWSKNVLMVDYPALISRADYHNVFLNEILYIKVGLIRGHAQTGMFLEWFPEHFLTKEYGSTTVAFNALDNGDVDLVMACTRDLLFLANYMERTNFKANYIFDELINFSFAFSKDEVVLCSIFDKAFRLMDTDRISDQWTSRIYDYQFNTVKEQRQWLTGISILFLSALIFVAVLFMRNRYAKKQLELHSTMLSTVYESMPDVLLVTDVCSVCISCNPSFEEMVGLPESQITGKTFAEVSRDENLTEAFYQADIRIIADSTKAIKTELSVSYPDGSIKTMELFKTPMIQGGKIIGILGIARDVTAYKEAQETALTALRAKGTFLATMSHEIRTPINAIIGMTAIGEKSDNMEGKNYALTKINEASTHLLGVINAVLDMSKIEAHKLELVPVEFNFERMLEKAIAIISFRVVEKRQKFLVYIDSKVPRLLVGDDQRLTQVIINLLSNAVKFTPQEGEISLNVFLVDKEDDVCEIKIEVTDNGIGISPEQQKNLFDPFEQVESAWVRKFGGAGLGLPISKNIVEMMDGRIWIESELGKGSRFIFTIKVPYGKEDLRSQLAPGVQWEKLRVLAVDDLLLARQYFNNIFDQLGLHCETVEDGPEACKIIEESGGFDIYFIDWHMPKMDGLDLVKWIKSRGIQGSKVVLVSFSDLEETMAAAVQSGADKCLVKPLLSSTIINCLNDSFRISDTDEHNEQDNEFAGKTLLIVEDIDINREILLTILENTGLTIDCAENGAESVTLIEANPEKYDVVFMDIHMPVMDGLEATRRIRAMSAPQCQTMPIIAMTANIFKSDIDACLEAGMNDHLGKPVDIEEMFEKLRKVFASVPAR